MKGDLKCFTEESNTKINIQKPSKFLSRNWGPLEMASHSSILAWKIPWTESGGLQAMGTQRVGED